MARHQLRGQMKGQRAAAVVAVLAVLGVGAVSTLASWTDSEWVFGGLDGGPGVGTSSFNVEQNTDPGVDSDAWTDKETNPGGKLTFSVGALALSPGDAIYAPVALRTAVGSVDGTVQLQAAVAAAGVTVSDAGGALWDAVEVAVITSSSSLTCDNTADFTSPLGSGELGSEASSSTASQNLAGADESTPGAAQYYCFRLSLPNDASAGLQGRTIAPAWEFAATSS